ncbi:major tail protein [Lacrimispora sp. NSJ-141]|uniref:Major tail protein n=1 Tax=Lientehia hominis TaxID=2897778 RepID=A0AAP2W9F3_9FIRM|nr:major tail protein [Lientehia hominis]MCD2493315.1 major tail protein [Lientehia hominis]
MAYIGLRKPIIGKLDAETGKYSAPITFGKAIGLQVTPSYAEGSLNADDMQAEYDKEFNYADVTLNTSTIPLQAHQDMFGHTVVTESEKSVEFNANDQNNYVGMGWITVEKVDGVRAFTGNFLYKVKFSEPAEDYATKGDAIEYKTPSIAGRAVALADGKWKSVGVFDTEAAALEWINGKFGVEKA